jgi:exopolysaccharide biosynthesis polyprenyl glycosylphosphotransferase
VISWWIVPALFAVTTVGTIGVRAAVRAVTGAMRTYGAACRVVLVGSGPRAAAMWAELCADPNVRYELVGLFDTADAVPHPAFAGQALGALPSLERALMHLVVDQVLIALPVRSRYAEIEATILTCERAGLESRVPADVFRPTLARPSIESASGTPVVAMHVVSRGGELLAKRAIDVVGALCGLVLLSPLLAATALAVRLTSPGPALFAQERYGLQKRRFRMYKFRTMVVDAEQQQAALEEKNEVSGPVFKIGGDPRVTPLGRFLRQSSIDELPQLWNVLRGDMSLVGPRPLPLRDVGRFDEPWLMRRFSVRPGLTCLWQISGRSTLGFSEWIKLDLEYIDRWSLALDMEILMRTVPAVVKGVGAA